MIEIKNLCLKYIREYYALYNVNMHIKKGEAVAFVGKEKSGKTTLLRVLAKLEKFDKGEIYIRDIPIKRINYREDISMGYIPSTPVFLENETVFENLKFVLKDRRYTQMEMEEKINDTIIDFNLAELKDEQVKNLSLFQKYYLSFARLSLRKLDIVLIDDFAENLTNEEQINILYSLTKKLFIDKNVTTILASASKDFVENLVTKIYEFDNGSLV